MAEPIGEQCISDTVSDISMPLLYLCRILSRETSHNCSGQNMVPRHEFRQRMAPLVEIPTATTTRMQQQTMTIHDSGQARKRRQGPDRNRHFRASVGLTVGCYKRMVSMSPQSAQYRKQFGHAKSSTVLCCVGRSKIEREKEGFYFSARKSPSI
jgi:hypothetical protein